MSDLVIRNARPEDAKIAGELIYFAGQCFFNHTFGFGTDKEKALDFIEYAYVKEAGAFSYKFATIAESDDKIVGLELGYDGDTKKKQDSIVEKQIMKYYKLPQLIRLFRRGLHVNKFFDDAPNDVYYLASIAVVPEARGRGISNVLIENVFRKMEKGGLKRCILDVSITKENVIGLYRKFGFKIIGEYRNPKLEKRYNLEGQYRMVYIS